MAKPVMATIVMNDAVDAPRLWFTIFEGGEVSISMVPYANATVITCDASDYIDLVTLLRDAAKGKRRAL